MHIGAIMSWIQRYRVLEMALTISVEVQDYRAPRCQARPGKACNSLRMLHLQATAFFLCYSGLATRSTPSRSIYVLLCPLWLLCTLRWSAWEQSLTSPS